MKQRIIIAGSREFRNYELLENTLNEYLSDKAGDTVEIISGTAKGADTLGELYAKEHGIPLLRCPADWDRYGRSAGVRRNEEMAILSVSDGYRGCLFAFWDGVSRGTQHMIRFAGKYCLEIHIIRI